VPIFGQDDCEQERVLPISYEMTSLHVETYLFLDTQFKISNQVASLQIFVAWYRRSGVDKFCYSL